MTFEIIPKKILRMFLYIIAFLLLANIIGIIYRIYFDHNYLYDGLFKLFDFDTEKNIPTFYSSLALIIVSILLLFIASMHRSSQRPYILWILLSAIFLFLSIDEIASIHEQLSRPIRVLLGTSGVFYYAWVIPYSIALGGFVILYFKFLLELPKNIMVLFLISGAIFVLGAVGFEMLGSCQAELYGDKGLLYCIFYTCEEFLEMLGVVIFIYALLKYILTQMKYLKITLIEN